MGARVTGFGELDGKLDALKRLTRDEMVTAALEAGGEVIADEARRLVPERTGQLHDSIAVSTEALNFAADAVSYKGKAVFVGPQQGSHPDGFYGHMVEFGTFRTTPRPFMRPAFDAKRDEAIQAISERMAAEIERVAKE